MSQPEEFPIGEDPSTDFRRPFAKHLNSIVKRLKSDNTFMNLGEEHGEFRANRLRFRDAREEGHLRVYFKQEATDPKVIVPSVIALGVLAAGIHHLKHRKK